MIDLRDPVALALCSAEAFRRANIRHALYGGLLLAAYGEARETKDADLAVVDVDTGAAAKALADTGLNVHVAFEDVPFGGVVVTRLTVVAGSALNTVDLVRARDPAFAVRVLGRAARTVLRGHEIDVVTLEDFVLLKALSTRDKDLDDAASVIRRNLDAVDAFLDVEASALAAALPDVPVLARLAEIRRRAT